MTRERSPRYPSIGLGEAIELAGKLWRKERRTTVTPDVIAAAWGYKGASGPVRAKIGALRQYGLLQKEGAGLRVSDIGVEILAHPEGSQERRKSIREAALSPELFKKIHENFREGSDDAIRAYLITKEGFSEQGAKQFVVSFRDALALANLLDEAYTPPSKPILAVGDPVQWESNGILQLPVPKKIMRFSEDGRFAFVEGTMTGIPMEQLQKAEIPEPPARRPFYGQIYPEKGSGAATVVSTVFPLPRNNFIEITLGRKVTKAEFDQMMKLFELLQMSVVEEIEDKT